MKVNTVYNKMNRYTYRDLDRILVADKADF